MSTYRRWYCNCTGQPLELDYSAAPQEEGEEVEPFCDHCGATPSSDPKRTVSYEDEENWDE